MFDRAFVMEKPPQFQQSGELVEILGDLGARILCTRHVFFAFMARGKKLERELGGKRASVAELAIEKPWRKRRKQGKRK